MNSYILVCSLLLYRCLGDSFASQCFSSGSSSLKFSLSSSRNSTGHWIAQVKLGHGAGLKEIGPWEVDVDHSIMKCEGQDSAFLVATITGPGNKFIPSASLGYNLVAGLGYYKFHTDRKTWHEAQKICEKEGAHLAVINSEHEAKVLTNMGDFTWAYVGFHDIYVEGQYVTIFNQSLSDAGYAKWHSGEPAQGSQINYGCISKEDSTLGVARLKDTLVFICEKNL
ncbi:hemolymph lipopolysaccharide-binding protein-like [Periplaneta americana]|uniref:hemolymph lipopolysaccharide-binding protein-like n=1 Tax=Periplaneta americana TaxID=6978 RepID=UPI0037E843AF